MPFRLVYGQAHARAHSAHSAGLRLGQLDQLDQLDRLDPARRCPQASPRRQGASLLLVILDRTFDVTESMYMKHKS
jgi:hypothetical protein